MSETEFQQKDRLFRNRIEKLQIFKKFGNKCSYCGCTYLAYLTIDHKIPLSRGGEDELRNLDCVCGWSDILPQINQWGSKVSLIPLGV